MATEITQKDLEYALEHLCDAMDEGDMLSQAKGGSGLRIATTLCDAGGNFLYSTDIVYKYKEEADGYKHITAEVAGKIVEDYVFEYGIKQTVKYTLSSTLAVALDADPITGVAVGVMVFSGGYTVTKVTSKGAGALTTKLLEIALVDKDIHSYDGNNEIFQYKSELKQVTIGECSENQELLLFTFNYTNATTAVYNSITYDITQCDNLLVRNAIFDIPKVSFLLSHILIEAGDILDLGDKGLYDVGGGETFSQIAEANGMTTQQLLSYNTWLIDDDNRVTFDQDKVLVANLEPSDFTDKDHNLIGCELEDRLIDHNDGDDTLLGMGGDDYLDGGKGADQLVGGTDFDTYISDNGDKIFDEDGEGEVYFDKTLLTGGKKEAGSGCEPTEDDGSSVYKGNGGTYTLSGDTLTFEKGGETLTILNLNDKRMVA